MTGDQIIRSTPQGPQPEVPTPIPGQDGFGGVRITENPPSS